jgi:UDP-N-acetylmuramate--alanine ligase
MSLGGVRTAHFVGIGGAGMSAIAKVLLERGVSVSGSDLKRSRAATMLEATGARLRIGHEASLVEGADVVVVSSAIPQSNPERMRAHELGLPILTRGEALADLLGTRRSIVVAGTHGKTTTTSMIVTVLRAAGWDPTYLVGGGLNDVGTNARLGRDDLIVAESDESDGSFLLLEPRIAVVTNVEADHLDHWGGLAPIQAAFAAFLGRVQRGGAMVVPALDEDLVRVAGAAQASALTFGPGGDVGAEDVRCALEGAGFTLTCAGAEARVQLRVPGHHNVLNALAAAAACLQTGVSVEDIARGLSYYRGVERRFQVRGQAGGVTVIDDYAHHPTEVRATLAAARTGRWDRVVAVFQPHLFSRTVAFKDEFGSSFADADVVVVTDVYGAREQPMVGVTGKLVADSVCRRLPGRPVAYLPHRAELLSYLQSTLRPGDVVLTLGAGDISSLGEELLAHLEAA